MMGTNRIWSLVLGMLVAASWAYASGPLKIYILAGQSNMQGTAQITTFPHMAMDSVSKPLHDKLVDEDGVPRVHEDVYITAISKGGGWHATIDMAKQGPLTVGYGGPLESETMFGPELAFGVTMQELAGEPILLIKASWGGRSLYEHFRPPSAGELPDGKASGHYYRLMMEHVKEVLADPGKFHPAYDPEQGYEVAGFVWFQGYNDQFAPYPHLPAPEGQRRGPKDFTEYSRLLACLIRDVREEVNTPDMPVAIGVIGIGGHRNRDGQPPPEAMVVPLEGPLTLRQAMAAPAHMPEFKGTVAAVQTADFWDHELQAAHRRTRRLGGIRDVAYGLTPEGDVDFGSSQTEGWQSLGTPSLEERRWRYTAFDTAPGAQYDSTMVEGREQRFFRQDFPAAYAGWQLPDFDDSNWQEGPAPIGRGPFIRRRNAPEIHSAWDDGNMLLMRTTITLDPADYEAFRVCIMAKESYNIYLNGEKLFSYVWFQRDYHYRAYYLTAEQAAHLKKGDNVLAVQANIRHHGRGDNRAETNWVNLLFEGITKADHEKLLAFYDTIATAKDFEIASGRSNQDFHYLGSAKIYSRIGEALAIALHEMDQKKVQP